MVILPLNESFSLAFSSIGRNSALLLITPSYSKLSKIKFTIKLLIFPRTLARKIIATGDSPKGDYYLFALNGKITVKHITIAQTICVAAKNSVYMVIEVNTLVLPLKVALLQSNQIAKLSGTAATRS